MHSHRTLLKLKKGLKDLLHLRELKALLRRKVRRKRKDLTDPTLDLSQHPVSLESVSRNRTNIATIEAFVAKHQRPPTNSDSYLAYLSRIQSFAQSLCDDDECSQPADTCHSDILLIERALVIGDISLQVPIQSALRSYITHFEACKEDKIKANIDVLSKKHPHEEPFSIAAEHVPRSEWKKVCDMMQRATSEGRALHGPTWMLREHARSAKCIYELHREEQEMGGEECVPFGADVFFPIYLYCLTHCGVRDIYDSILYMKNLCFQGNLKGEDGYYLAVLEASMEFIFRFDKDKEEVEADVHIG